MIKGQRIVLSYSPRNDGVQVGLRAPEGWMVQAKNEGSGTKFDAGEWLALVGLIGTLRV